MNDPGVNHSLTADNILASFPIALQGDASAAALGAITARLLARRPEEISQLRIYPMIDQLPERFLDILAYDFKVDWWDPNYTLAEKWRTLKDSWRVHKMLGTKAAVETAIRAIYPQTEVQEWFEYEGGRPYHFKLYIDLSNETGSEVRPWRVLEKVNFYKSLRSHLDRLEFTIQPKDPAILRLGGCAAAHVRFPIPEQADTLSFQGTVRLGGGAAVMTRLPVPQQADEIRMQGILRAGGSMTPSVRLPVQEDTAAAPVEKAFRTGGQTAVHVTAPVPEQQ